MYTMRVRIDVPPGRDPRALRDALERVAADLRVDLSV
jgi:glycine cleavage system regulatory protein